MKNSTLITPIHLKLSSDDPLPEDEGAYYLMTASGLFICRNHAFHRSCVPAPRFPCELAEHKASLELSLPRIPQRMFEQVVGYFSRVAVLHGSEAAVLLVWNEESKEVELVVPSQVATVSTSKYGKYRSGLSVAYETPVLPPHRIIFGDIHSHVEAAAYASRTDEHDEIYRTGIHIVVGRISRDPPDLHLEYVVDGTRFLVKDPAWAIEGYEARRENEVPDEWMDCLRIENAGWTYRPGGSEDGYEYPLYADEAG